MPHNDTHHRARSLRRLSVDELGAYALQEELIDALETFEDRTIITQGDHRFVLPPRQATTFLIGMLRGRSWYVDDPVAEYGPAPRSAANIPPPTAKNHNQEAQTAPPSKSIPPLDVTLRSLLTFTKAAGIIEGYDYDAEERSVRIDISACSTQLPYVEAVNYLFDCIQHEMRMRRGAATAEPRNTPGRSPSTLANEH